MTHQPAQPIAKSQPVQPKDLSKCKLITLYILMRKLSAYTDDDIILGVFTTNSKALAAKQLYIQTVTRDGDPHKRQGYMTVNLKEDVRITNNSPKEVSIPLAQLEPILILDTALGSYLIHDLLRIIAEYMAIDVTILVKMTNGFGQNYAVKIELVFGREAARNLVSEDEATSEPMGYPEWWEQEDVMIDQLKFENHRRGSRGFLSE